MLTLFPCLTNRARYAESWIYSATIGRAVLAEPLPLNLCLRLGS
jgi:hypothetical protein